MSAPLRGVAALVWSKRHALSHAPLGAGLLAVLGAALLRFSGEPVGDDPAVFLLCAGLVVLAAPIVAAVNLTIGMTPKASRRDELLLLPVGRLALPAAVGLVSAALHLACAAAVLAGWSLVRPGALEALADVRAATLLPALAILASGATVMTAVTALGNSTSTVAFGLWTVAAGFSTLLSTNSGDPQVTGTGLRWCVALGLCALAAPAVFLRRGPVALTELRSNAGAPERTDAWFVLGGASAAVAFVVHGALAALGVGGLALVLSLRSARAVQPRAPRPGRALAATLVLGSALPLAPFAVADARRVAALDRGDGVVADLAASPDGRRVAVLLRPRPGDGDGDHLRRVLVVDLDGGAPPRVIPARGALLPRGAWSADGRWLAVDDVGLGRLAGREAHAGPSANNGRSTVKAVEDALDRWASESTLVLDVTTGEVQRLGRRLVAPGWRDPSELVRLTLDAAWRGDRIVDDRRGFGVDVAGAPWRDQPTSMAYAGGVLVVGESMVTPAHEHALVGLDLGVVRWRLDPGGFTPQDAGWLVVRDPRRPPGHGVAGLRRGERQVALDAAAVWPDPHAPGEGVLVADDAGLARLRLADGARTPLRATWDVRRQALWPADDGGPSALVREVDGTFSWLDLRDGASRPARGVKGGTWLRVSPERFVRTAGEGPAAVGLEVVGVERTRAISWREEAVR